MEPDLATKLQKVVLSEKEKGGVQLKEDDVNSSLDDCRLSLIGKVYGEKRANLNGLKATVGAIWTTKESFNVRGIGNNLFQFLFKSEEDRDRILDGKTWSFDGQYILLKKWEPDQTSFYEDEEKIKIWVQIHHVPLHWLTEET
ncbi:Unknown protein [Striga hermonthica]|uniref:DUF4283 domain-containing protein n=1 Tax=Striga hermonthica TaxID=68872 RepID=A0A9N7MBK3_STRHE|nr:Unknown protein [Striga hermonthica]